MNEMLKRVYIKEAQDETVFFQGILFLENKFVEYVGDRVKNRFLDTDWTSELVERAKEALQDTGFDISNLEEILSNNEEEDNWRIGECLAECVLEDHFSAQFHYNNSRDAKNPNGNDTGADLVGLYSDDQDVIFLFGEVKTSYDTNTPPQVLYGKSGMINQLEALRDEESKRSSLVRWIWSKAVAKNGSDFHEKCALALRNYLVNKKLKLVGVLVRDTDVNKKDLYSRAKALNDNITDGIQIELISIYSGYKMENDNWLKAINGG
ncbi:hypothetical protein H1Z61_07795 [Bacillus aquiflavi]|uniref:Anti-bacteriophage protein A/HamA C-terminal domain-containing protein n=2 Tax=Bacillus aquiflavi TaxID=2672567 RepID=A0A6B3VVT9_9BACI|nr:hypothetical protein [Bacillus aquiflavi]MBA4537051.1 hypothetical protein [Bacillus aquiflavi]NEY81348.1 hypothetical protein [Bacillus aquiflavi]